LSSKSKKKRLDYVVDKCGLAQLPDGGVNVRRPSSFIDVANRRLDWRPQSVTSQQRDFISCLHDAEKNNELFQHKNNSINQLIDRHFC